MVWGKYLPFEALDPLQMCSIGFCHIYVLWSPRLGEGPILGLGPRQVQSYQTRGRLQKSYM